MALAFRTVVSPSWATRCHEANASRLPAHEIDEQKRNQPGIPQDAGLMLF